MARSDRWVFTINNPDNFRPQFIDATMDYLVWEIERGEQGTEHVQGYVRFKTRKHLEAAQRLISPRAHMELARGNEQQCRDYCLKDSATAEHLEAGIFDPQRGRQGRRTDLEAIHALITNGMYSFSFEISNILRR